MTIEMSVTVHFQSISLQSSSFGPETKEDWNVPQGESTLWSNDEMMKTKRITEILMTCWEIFWILAIINGGFFQFHWLVRVRRTMCNTASWIEWSGGTQLMNFPANDNSRWLADSGNNVHPDQPSIPLMSVLDNIRCWAVLNNANNHHLALCLENSWN